MFVSPLPPGSRCFKLGPQGQDTIIRCIVVGNAEGLLKDVLNFLKLLGVGTPEGDHLILWRLTLVLNLRETRREKVTKCDWRWLGSALGVDIYIFL